MKKNKRLCSLRKYLLAGVMFVGVSIVQAEYNNISSFPIATGFGVLGNSRYCVTVGAPFVSQRSNPTIKINEGLADFIPVEVVESSIIYKFANNKDQLSFNWDLTMGFFGQDPMKYKVGLTPEPSRVDTTILSNETAVKSWIASNIPDSRSLTFHVFPVSMSGFEGSVKHKHVPVKKLTTLTPFSEDFNNQDPFTNSLNRGLWKWGPSSNSWRLDSGCLVNDGTGDEEIFIDQRNMTWKNYEVSAAVIFPDSNETVDFSLLFRRHSDSKYCAVQMKDEGGQGTLNVCHYDSDSANKINLVKTMPKVYNAPFNIRLVVRYDERNGFSYVTTYISGELKDQFYYLLEPYGGVGFRVKGCHVKISNFKIQQIN